MYSGKLEIKKLNRNRVFRHILERGQTSMSEIAKDLQISLPTVAAHIASLEEEDLLVEGGLYASTGGRRAKAIGCDPRARVGCGINITRNTVDLVAVDLKGSVIDYTKMTVRCEINGAYLAMLRGSLLDMIRRSGLPDSAVLGVGISLPAIIDGRKRICDTAFEWPVPEHFQEDLQASIPFRLDYFNDASSGGYAEFWDCKTSANLFYLSLSETVGGAVRVHGRVLDGDDYRSAEIGHTTIVPDGRPCYCGQLGCMNAYCSSNNLATPEDGGLKQFFAQLEAGNAECLRKWDEYLHYLSIAVNNIRQLYDCDVILGGAVGRFLPAYLPQLRQLLRQRDSFHRDTDYVRPCKYHSESSAVGAALLFVDQFLDAV